MIASTFSNQCFFASSDIDVKERLVVPNHTKGGLYES